MSLIVREPCPYQDLSLQFQRLRSNNYNSVAEVSLVRHMTDVATVGLITHSQAAAQRNSR